MLFQWTTKHWPLLCVVWRKGKEEDDSIQVRREGHGEKRGRRESETLLRERGRRERGRDIGLKRERRERETLVKKYEGEREALVKSEI